MRHTYSCSRKIELEHEILIQTHKKDIVFFLVNIYYQTAFCFFFFLGLSHLMGTNLLRAYMHGFFIDIRLYHKVTNSFQYNLSR